MIGKSSAMQEALDMARRSATSKAPVLISGESGVGRKTLARHIHQLSGATGPCIVVNASVLDDDSIGQAIHAARGGSLVLEGVEQLSAKSQVVLLYAICGNAFGISELGSEGESGIRVLSTTCSELISSVLGGTFRQDLYWTISTLSIHVPPLRERPEDLSDLAQAIIDESCRHHGRGAVAVSEEALQAIKQYQWPGNLSQLRCFLERSSILSDSLELGPESVRSFVDAQSKTLQSDDSVCRTADEQTGSSPYKNSSVDSAAEVAPSHFSLPEIADLLIQKGIIEADLARVPLHSFIVDHVEKQLISHVLAECEQVQLKAAARLGINRNTLHKKLKEYRLGETE